MKTLYIRTNLDNGKQYVGQTKDIKRRERDWHKFGSSYANQEIDKDREVYGLKNWKIDVLEECDDSIADEKEREYIIKYNTLSPYGYNHYNGGICGFTFHQLEETKQKISQTTKGIPKSEETKERISKGLMNHPSKSKPVYQYTIDGTLVAVYYSAREAARQLGFSQGNISNCCNGGFYRKGKWIHRNQYNGYIWSYKPL